MINSIHGSKTSCRSQQSLSYSRIFNILWNPKVWYLVVCSHSLAPILNHKNPAHITASYFCVIQLDIVNRSRSIFFWLSNESTIFSLVHYVCYMSCPLNPPWLGHSSYIWQSKSYETPDYAIWYTFLLFDPFWVQVFSLLVQMSYTCTV
jgi:hypothetical protein